MAKENDEIKACTFKPMTNKKSEQYVYNNDYKNKDKFYERLYKEGEVKQQLLRNMQMIKDHKDVAQCTFHPDRALTERPKHNSSISSMGDHH